MARPTLIGVTGGIGAGKSAAVESMRRRGAAVFSADEAVHRLYDDPEVVAEVRGRWGDRVFAPDGSVDREAIAAIVFHDRDELRWLEGLLHPLVAREWLRFVDHHARSATPPPYVVGEVPLLFEAGLEDRYDVTVLVTAPEAIRLQRVGERARGASHVAGRMGRQLSEEEKAARADHVLDNSGNPEDLDASIGDVLAQIDHDRRGRP